MTVKAILCDLDGVLVPAKELHYQAFNEALMEVTGKVISRQEHIEDFNGLPTKVKLRALVDQGRVKPEEFDDISRIKQDKTWELIPQIIERDETIVGLGEYWKERGYKVACVTNSIRHSTILLLRACGIFPYIDTIISNEDMDAPKPEPDGYWQAMRAFGVHPGECVIVEDSHKGFKSAVRTGCLNIWYVRGVDELTIPNFNQFMDR